MTTQTEEDSFYGTLARISAGNFLTQVTLESAEVIVDQIKKHEERHRHGLRDRLDPSCAVCDGLVLQMREMLENFVEQGKLIRK